jgi:ligand-binding sensor domain-containing protein/signal transduction histidine kinase
VIWHTIGRVQLPALMNALRMAAVCGSLMLTAGLGGETVPGDSEYLGETWRTEDGLPQNTVTCLTQTRDGYLWLGTHLGLVRFDGLRFRVFDAGNTPELKSGRIATLFEDRQGALWVGTEGGGLARLELGAWTNYSVREGLAHEVVNALGEDGGGRLWVGTLAGLCRWQAGHFVPEPLAAGMAARAIGGLARDGQGELWVLAGNALGSLQAGGWTAAAAIPGANGAAGLFRDRAGSLWVFGEDLLLVTKDGPVTNFLAAGALAGHFLTAVCEAQNGDFWLGTRAGVLLRVRGGQVAAYGAGRSGVPSPVRCLLEDHEGNLWVGTDGGGLNRLKPRHIMTFTSRDGLRNEGVTSLAADGAGGLWVGTRCGGLHRWKDGRLTPFAAGSELTANACIGPLLRTRDGSLWIGTFGDGLFRLTGSVVTRFGRAEGLLDGQVLSLLEDREGTLWVGTYDGGLHRFHPGQPGRLASDPACTGKIITCLAQQPNGDLWVGTGGMGVFRGREGRFAPFTRQQGLGSDFIQTLFVDSAGALWVGTGGGGLARWVSERFVSITAAQGLREDVVSQILEETVAGNLWLGGNRGLSRVSLAELNEFIAGTRPAVSALAFGKTDGMESLECASGFYPAGLRSPDDRLWFATVKGLVQVTPFAIGNTLPGISGDNISFGNPRLKLAGTATEFDLANLVGGGNGLGGGTNQGLHPVTGQFATVLESRITDPQSRPEGRYHRTASPFIDGVFIPDGGVVPDGRVLIASTGIAVVLPDTTGEAWGLLSRFSGDPNPAFNRRRETLGGVDYGTSGRSILNMSGNLGLTFDLAAVRTATGHAAQRFSATAGNGWVGPASFHVFVDGVRVAFRSDVLKDLDRPAANIFALDVALPAGARFLTLVATDDKDNPRYANNANTLPPPVHIEEVLVDGIRVPEGGPRRSAPAAAGVTVRPGQERLEIHFTALSFTAPEKVRFRYQLEGFDPKWVEAGQDRYARYTKLPAGQFRFRVLACNNDGVWNEAGASFALSVIPPLWRTAWFLGTALLAATAGVAGTARFVTKRRMHRKLERLRQQHAVEQERTRIARDMHDEIGAKLTKISFLSELVKRDLPRPVEAEKQIDQVSDTARQLIRALDEIVWAVNPKNDTLENLANYLCRYAGDYFQNTDLQCQFDIPTQVPDCGLSSDARHNLFLAVKEALHNTLKHSGATQVRVRIAVQHARLEVFVADNGRGFNPDATPPAVLRRQRVGTGLVNMRQRLADIRGRCDIVSAPGQGTTATFTLPLPPRPARP